MNPIKFTLDSEQKLRSHSAMQTGNNLQDSRRLEALQYENQVLQIQILDQWVVVHDQNTSATSASKATPSAASS